MDFLNLCKKLISIDSTPTAGNDEVVKFCSQLCTEFGLSVTLQEGSIGKRPQSNLLAYPKKSKSKAKVIEEVIFQTHLDTVEPGPMGNWTETNNNAFNATIKGDCIYGLGSADVKLDFLCKLRALKEFANTKMKKPFVLIGTFGEEVGLRGAQQLMMSEVVNAKMAIIGEPSELQLCYANNGMMVVEFNIPFSAEEMFYRNSHVQREGPSTTQEKVFHGKSVHSSTPHLGENAITKMIDYLSKMPDGLAVWQADGGQSINTVPGYANIEIDPSVVFISSVGSRLMKIVRRLELLEKEFKKYNNKEFSPSHPTFNIAMLRTNLQGLKLHVSFRLTPEVSDDVVTEWVHSMQDHINTLGGECRVVRQSTAALTPLTSPLFKGAIEISKKLNLPAKPITKAGGTESSIYTKFGIDCLVFGPGVSLENSHAPNEFNKLSEMEKATEFYAEAVKRFCV